MVEPQRSGSRGSTEDDVLRGSSRGTAFEGDPNADGDPDLRDFRFLLPGHSDGIDHRPTPGRHVADHRSAGDPETAGEDLPGDRRVIRDRSSRSGFDLEDLSRR